MIFLIDDKLEALTLMVYLTPNVVLIFVYNGDDVSCLLMNILKGKVGGLIKFSNVVFELWKLIVEVYVSFGIVHISVLYYLDDFHLLLIDKVYLLN